MVRNRHPHRSAILFLIGLVATLPILVLFLVQGWDFRPANSFDHSSVLATVADDQGPVAGDRVRYQGDARALETDAQGQARFEQVLSFARVTAAKEGYYIAGAAANTNPIALFLRQLPVEDAESYAWVAPTPDATQPQNCGNCHESIYHEWASGGHARSANNRRFLNVYDGTDWSGQRQAGWNLLAEYPDGAGVCTACHAPSVGFEDPAYYDLRKVRGPSAQGVHCDYCHKIESVTNGQFGLTHGRFGLKLLRPAQGQLFFGPLDDVDRGEDAFSPLYKESRYCASCHEGTVFGVPVYTTYSEWLQSPARGEGKQCQNCHMPPTGTLGNVAPGKGGIDRDPLTLSSHRFFAGDQLTMLRGCLKVTVRLTNDARGAHAEVTVRADAVGHRVPTGFVDRHLLLLVEAFDSQGKAVAAEKGSPVLPELAGKTYARLSGRLYAKQTSDFDGRHPVPFWLARPEVVDSRLVPGVVDQSSFTFTQRIARVRVRLLYRRFWEKVAISKGWPDNELVIVDRTWNTLEPMH